MEPALTRKRTQGSMYTTQQKYWITHKEPVGFSPQWMPDSHNLGAMACFCTSPFLKRACPFLLVFRISEADGAFEPSWRKEGRKKRGGKLPLLMKASSRGRSIQPTNRPANPRMPTIAVLFHFVVWFPLSLSTRHVHHLSTWRSLAFHSHVKVRQIRTVVGHQPEPLLMPTLALGHIDIKPSRRGTRSQSPHSNHSISGIQTHLFIAH